MANLEELEKKIESKIGDLEQEKERLKDDLKVVRQAVSIAVEFEGSGGKSEWQEPDHGYEASQAV
jgi:hypothetical protein